jgi:hypothetical protein
MREVRVVDHRRDQRQPIKVVRVRATDSLRHWRDTDTSTSEVARYPVSWHDVEQDPDNGDIVIRKRETARSNGDNMITPGTAGPIRQNGEQEHDVARDVLGHADPAARIRARQARERTHDRNTLHSMNARNRAFWAGRS